MIAGANAAMNTGGLTLAMSRTLGIILIGVAFLAACGLASDVLAF